MNCKELKELWKKEESMNFKGWDFVHLDNRWEEEGLPWDYRHLLMKYLEPADKLLDMGTGGGEFLLTLNHPPCNTSVTEAWEPNVKLCLEKLEPLGIEVKQVFSDSELPFEDDAFDIVSNKHEAYDIKEVKRILKPGGYFITQQVGGKNNEVLSRALIENFSPVYGENTLDNALEEMHANSFEVLSGDEYYPYLRFKDIGAVVYLAKIIEWEFPGFSVDRCFEELCELNEKLKVDGYVESFEHRFMIVCMNIK